MQIVCDGLDLCDAVITVSRAINPKATNPILEGIKIVASDDELTLSATDLELSIEKKIKAEVKEEGETVVPGRFFGELIKKLTSEQIELRLVENNTLKIKYTDSETIVQCLPVYEFPNLKKIEGGNFFALEKRALKNLITKTVFSVAADDTRPVLTGCLLEVNGDTIKTVALDGYRMAVYTEKIKDGTVSSSVVVPARSLNEIAKLLDDSEDQIDIYFQDNFIMCDLNGCIITTRLLEGEFINYKQIISPSFETNIKINRRQLEGALERASLLSKIGQNNLVQFDIQDSNLCITSRSEIGNIRENLSILHEGKELIIAFNARYFMEALKTINDEFVMVKFNQSQNPCVICPCEQTEKYLYLILPVRLMKA